MASAKLGVVTKPPCRKISQISNAELTKDLDSGSMRPRDKHKIRKELNKRAVYKASVAKLAV